MSAVGVLKRYRSPIAIALAFAVFLVAFPRYAPKAEAALAHQIVSMIFIIPPIFLLLGLLDAWVPRETMMRFMGNGSGPLGGFLAFALGSAAAGPLYGAFPVAGVLMQKGASLTNVFIFIGAWSTTKIPMLLFESSSLGYRFALARLAIDVPGIVAIAFALKIASRERDERAMRDSAGNG